MTTSGSNRTWDQKLREALLSPVVRRHLLIAGIALFAAGAATPWLLSDLSLWWTVVAAVLAGHIGLLMVFGGTVLRRLTRKDP